MNQQYAKLLIYIGILLVIIGVVWYFFGNKQSWIGRLPGDIRIERDQWKFYFPITTMAIFSLFISLLLYLIKKFL